MVILILCGSICDGEVVCVDLVDNKVMVFFNY